MLQRFQRIRETDMNELYIALLTMGFYAIPGLLIAMVLCYVRYGSFYEVGFMTLGITPCLFVLFEIIIPKLAN